MSVMTISSDVVPRLSRRAWLVLGGDALSAVGSGLTLPFFLVYLHRVRGIELGAAGLILATVAVAGLAGNPAGGWLADRIGPRRAVLAGLVVVAAGTAGFAAVHTARAGFAAAGVYGFGAAVLWPAQDALLATAVGPAQRSQVFAVRHATLNAGLGAGALAAAMTVSFASAAGFVLIYLLDAASYLVFALIVARIGDVAADRIGEVAAAGAGTAGDGGPGGYRQVLADRLFRRLWLLVLLLVAAGFAQYHAAFPAFATGVGGLGARGLALAFAANTVTVVVAQLVVLRLMAGRRRTRGVILAAGLVAAAWLVTMLGGSHAITRVGPALFVAAMVLFGLGETLLSPTVPAIVNDLAPERLRGRYNGGYTLAWTAGFIAGPAAAGLALAAGQGQALFAGLIGVLCLAGLAAWRLERRLPPAANRVAGAPRPASPAARRAEPAPPIAVAAGGGA
jgi:MFS family permease